VPITLTDVYVHITLFLDHQSRQSVCCTAIALRFGALGTPLWHTHPWSPYRHRLWGFGIPANGQSTHHDDPAWIGTLPFVWTNLDPISCNICFQVCSSWKSYILLCIQACRTSVATLRAP
jgi:hypothetical protein